MTSVSWVMRVNSKCGRHCQGNAGNGFAMSSRPGSLSPGLCRGGDCLCGRILPAGDAASAQVGETFQVWHER